MKQITLDGNILANAAQVHEYLKDCLEFPEYYGNNLDALHELLKLIGSKPFSIKDFNMRYKSVSDVNMNANDLINYLYETGIILNIDLSKRPPLFRSIIRNNGKLDRNQKMIIHSGVWKGLNS